MSDDSVTTDFEIEPEREIDHVFLDQLRALAAKIEAENEKIKNEANDGR